MDKKAPNKKPNISLIQNSLLLAPMVRINTLPFRLLCFNHGCDITFTEEIIAKKLIYCERKYNETLDYYEYRYQKDNSPFLKILPSEKNHLILQLGASSPEDAVKAASIAKDDIIGIDINMGCPKYFSTHGNMGSSLLNFPDLANEILSALVKEFPDKIISCKIRLIEEKEKFENFIEKIQSSGIDFFTIHLRYKEENAKFPAKWNQIERVKKLAKIPFIINGDIFSPRDIQRLIKEYNCEGFMIGRGALHNPRIFEEYKILNEDLDLVQFNLDDSNIKLTIEDIGNEDKREKNSIDADSVQISNKLSKVFEKKYNKQKIDILPLIKELIDIGKKYENPYGNTKYVVLYILKTHRRYNKIFQQIQNSKTHEEMENIINSALDCQKEEKINK